MARDQEAARRHRLCDRGHRAAHRLCLVDRLPDGGPRRPRGPLSRLATGSPGGSAVRPRGYFTACGTGRLCSPAGPEVARGFRASQAIAMTTAVTTAAYGCACLSITSPRKAPAAMPTTEATRRRAEYAVSDKVTRRLNRSM